jgi:S1-C subfamily serine protease
VLGEDAPVTGLTFAQKLGFAVVAVGVLAVVGFFIHRSTSGDGGGREEDRRAAADGSGIAPARKDSQASQPAPLPTPGVPEPKAPVQVQPIEPVPGSDVPEEDNGAKVDSTNPPVKPSSESPGPKPPVVTDAPPKPVPDPVPPKPVTSKPPAAESKPPETRPTSPEADTYRPSGAGIYDRLLKSSVMVLRKDETGTRASRGSGSLVDREHKLVLTNYHVVGDASEVFVTFPVYESGKLLVASDAYRRKFANNEFTKAKVVHVLKGQDLALVELEKLPAGVSVLRPAGRSARPGEVVHSIGNPGASDAAWLYTKGEVRQVSHKNWQAKGGDGRILSFDAEVLETTSPTNPGDSGGPLVNDSVQLVGVTQGANTGARGVSLFIDVSRCAKFSKSKDSTSTAGEATPPGRTIPPPRRSPRN